MYAICVTLDLVPGVAAQFMPLMQAQAQNSLREETDCHRFDICTDSSAPDRVFLYELYTDKTAFEHHLQTAHFKTFDSQTAPLVQSKTVASYDMVTITP